MNAPRAGVIRQVTESTHSNKNEPAVRILLNSKATMKRWVQIGLTIAMTAVVPAQPQFAMQFLPNLGGTYNEPLAIGPSSHITGYSMTAANEGHGYVYSGGTLTELPPFGGTWSYGTSVNVLGHVVGNTSVSGPNPSSAFVYRDGAMADLGEPESGSGLSASGINDDGQVAVFADLAIGVRSFLLENGVFTPLGTLNGESTFANDINNSGQIVGYSMVNSYAHPFLYDGGLMTDLGVLLESATATAINDNGTVVGWGTVGPFGEHALIWQGGDILDIGTLGGEHSRALALNNLGMVVGEAQRSDSSSGTFLYAAGNMYEIDLLHDQPEWTVVRANGINDAGQIVGVAIRRGSSESRGVLLNPVPEPASMVGLGLGAVVLLRRRRTESTFVATRSAVD